MRVGLFISCVGFFAAAFVVVAVLHCRYLFPLVVPGAVSLEHNGDAAAGWLCRYRRSIAFVIARVYAYPNSINGTTSLGKCLYDSLVELTGHRID